MHTWTHEICTREKKIVIWMGDARWLCRRDKDTNRQKNNRNLASRYQIIYLLKPTIATFGNLRVTRDRRYTLRNTKNEKNPTNALDTAPEMVPIDVHQWPLIYIWLSQAKILEPHIFFDIKPNYALQKYENCRIVGNGNLSMETRYCCKTGEYQCHRCRENWGKCWENWW